MKLEFPLKIKKVHVHIVADVPGKEDAEFNMLINDPDKDGDPNYRIKWNMPGSILDSGPEGFHGEVPVMSFVRPIVNSALEFAINFAPKNMQAFLRGLKLGE